VIVIPDKAGNQVSASVGETFINKGGLAHKPFYLQEGMIQIIELDKTLGPGSLVERLGYLLPIIAARLQ
jgi:hypothetical protein